jgi:hypothetical protein
MRRIHLPAIAGVAALALHCSEQAIEGDTTPADAADCACNNDPPSFEKLQEGTLTVDVASTLYETTSVDVSRYREVVLRVDGAPYYGDSSLRRMDVVVPAFSDTTDGPFMNSGLSILSQGGRIAVNGAFLRLRYASINDESFGQAYAVYGVR